MNRLRCIMTWLVLGLSTVYAQAKTKKVLFIGNSYTSTNDLPGMIAKMAAAGSDTLLHAENVPGGLWFRQHLTHPTTLNLLARGDWDYVVLQEQSQAPSFPEWQFYRDVYPYARQLDSLVHKYNKCAKTVFYMTWGRQIGDTGNCANNPLVCTYEGMDSLLQLRYSKMAQDFAAQLCPVGKVWRAIRTQHPAIALYNPLDGSHPLPEGTFIAASAFYSMFFEKDPGLNTFTNGLPGPVAQTIKQTAKAIVFDSLGYWKRHAPEPPSTFFYAVNNNTVSFHSEAIAGVTYEWDFGDASPKDNTANPNHTYAQQRTYTVCLKACNACDTVLSCKTVMLGTTGIPDQGKPGARLYPSPTTGLLIVELPATGYRYGIYNAVGVRVREGRLLQARSSLDLSPLATGMYFMKITGADNRTEIVRFVKSQSGG